MAALFTIIHLVPRWSEGITRLLLYLFAAGEEEMIVYPLLLPALATFVIFAGAGWIAGAFGSRAGTREGKSILPYFLPCHALSAVLWFVLATAFFNPFTACIPGYHVMPMLLLACWGSFLLSLLQAALWLSVVTMWRVNAGASLVLAGILALSVAALVIPATIADQYTFTCTPGVPADPDGEGGEGGEGEGGDAWEEVVVVEAIDEEMEEMEETPWNPGEEGAASVEGALKFAIEFFHERGYWWAFWKDELLDYNPDHYMWDDVEGYNGYREARRIARYLQGAGDAVLSFFETHARVLHGTLPPGSDAASAVPRLATALDRAYRDLYGEEDDNRKSLELYRLMEAGEYSLEYYFDTAIASLASEAVTGEFRDAEGNVDKALVAWVYSFWGRREHEGTARAAREITREIVARHAPAGE
jgi:hypothetical protein